MTHQTQQLFSILVQFERNLWSLVDTRLQAREGISIARFQTLQVIRDQGAACRVLSVAEGLGITVGAASKLLDRLAIAGLVTRRPNPEDGRSVIVDLTEGGVRILTAAEEAFAEILADVFAGQAVLTGTVAAALTELDASIAKAGVSPG